MANTIGVAIIARNTEKTIKECLESFVDVVDQTVVVLAGESTDKTEEIVRSFPKVEVHNFTWIDDFAAARNFAFSKLTTDWMLWIDADDILYQPENLAKIVNKIPQEVGCLWFPYHYARDEFGNVCTLYERERLLRASYGWIWQSRIHETVSPLNPCKYVRTDEVIVLHNHTEGRDRGERNFRILNLMLAEEPENKRIWLYLGHQHFATQEWLKAAEWYLKFGTDDGALPLERFQALCYGSKALREMQDRQAIDVALTALNLYPEYKDGYLETAHSYLRFQEYDKAIHYAMLSDIKGLIKEPPSVIFINPLDYTFNRFALLAECYLRKGDLKTCLGYSKQAYEIRPLPQLQHSIAEVERLVLQERVGESVKVLAVHLLDNKELVKLEHLLHAVPYWWRETPDYDGLRAGIERYTKGLESKPEIVELEDKAVVVNVAKAFNLKELLAELDIKYDRITVVCPFPSLNVEQVNVLSQSDMERLIVTAPGRHIINLQADDKRVICEYDHKRPTGLDIKFFVGEGLEHWSPMTIAEIGCGGSETAVAMLAKELAKKDCQLGVYAMDNQVWEGVLYRHHSRFNAENSGCSLFISSRVPDVLANQIPARQKWLWAHDIHFWDRLTPDIASNIDVIVALSHWHVEHLKRAYPFLADCEVLALDDQDKTYEDTWTPHKFYEDETIKQFPTIAIIGDAIDTARFSGLTEKRVPYSFAWCSSPDRGLKEVLSMWPLLKKQMPEATLRIFYGWEYFDHSLQIPEQRVLKEELRRLIKQEGVTWVGRIGQRELARELKRTEAMLYPPHSFRETYGIAFLEAQAAGVICFYRQNGALGETIGNRGIPLSMEDTPEKIALHVQSVLSDKAYCAKIRKRATTYGLTRTWEKQANKVLGLFWKIENDKKTTL